MRKSVASGLQGSFNRPRSERQIQLQFRLSLVEHDGLWAVHCETRKSFSRLVREAVVEFLEKRGRLDPAVVQEILREESRARVRLRVPILE
jgi:hypothetical protein